ncbi:MAG: hypothetical protein QM729_06280 [Solirubrobacterales bacterium]
MKILITLSNFALGGTESYTTTVAEGLERMGHEVTIFAPEATDLGRRLAASLGLCLVVGELLPEDVDAVIAQDAGTAQMLAGRNPAPRMVFAIHGLASFEQPPRGLDPAPTVIAFNDRIAGRAAGLAERPPVVRMTQPIDIARFRPHSPVGGRPRRLLVLSNSLGPARLRMLQDACDDLGIELARVGGAGAPRISVREEIAAADIVVGYGRSVLEGMAMARPAYVWERGGGDGWVTPENYAALEADGFSGAATDDVIDAGRLREDLAAYRPELGEFGFELVRRHHSREKHVEALGRILGEGTAPSRQDSAETISLLVRSEKRSAGLAESARIAHDALLSHVRDLGAKLVVAGDRTTAERARREAAEAKLAEVLGSTSWRLTAPLRRLTARLRGR